MANRLNEFRVAASSRPKMPTKKAIESQMNSKYCFSGCQSHVIFRTL